MTSSLILLPGVRDLAADLSALQDAVAPIVTEGANFSAYAEAIVIPKVDEVLVPVSNAKKCLAKVSADFRAKITATRDAIFYQGKLYAAANGNLATQNQIIAEAVKLYGELNTDAKSLGVSLEPIMGLEDLLNDAHAMSIVNKAATLVATVSSLYNDIQHFHQSIKDVAAFFHGKEPIIHIPNLHLALISDVLKDVHAYLAVFTTNINKLADEITGEIPAGIFRDLAVRVRLDEIARNLKAGSTVESEEMRSTGAMKAFDRHTGATDTILLNGYFVLGNATEALSGVKSATGEGTALIEKAAKHLDEMHNYPAQITWLMHGQVIFCAVLATWVIFYACARKECLTGGVAAVLYAVSHIMLQVFVGYCVVLLIVIAFAKAIYDFLANGQCRENFLIDEKYTKFCRAHIFPTDSALPRTFHASPIMVISAYYLLMVYHTLSSDHLPSEEDSRTQKLEDTDDSDVESSNSL